MACFNIFGSPKIFPSDDDFLLIFVPMINDMERSKRLYEIESEEEEKHDEYKKEDG